ncbi:MAG: alanine--glyoxylate aminotransferase family protein [Candidatus Riflebacteria bacterium]|nr:alanine--glyoxylate aminotransferase family protein [Candidatus Riflebacteria bacterium]
MDQDILLMTPGPVQLDPEILMAGAQPLKHHRTNDFAPLYTECVNMLKKFFKTNQRLLLTTSSGTGVMETAIVNHFHQGETILSVETGAFGERFSEIAKAFRLNVVQLKYPWGYRAKVEDIDAEFKKHPDIKGVTVTFNETSTGVKNDLAAIGEYLKNKNVLFITDGVSGIGALPFEMDAWHIDVAISASQKGFLAPPGVGMIALSEKAVDKLNKVDCPAYYFNLKHYIKNQDLPIPSYPWTPAISVMFSLHAALKRIEKIGIEKLFSHYGNLAAALKESLKALNLSIFTQPDALSEVLTVINTPAGIHPKSIVNEIHDNYNVLLAGGQGHLADKVFRIATIGMIGEREMIATIGLLELALTKLGYLKEIGAGTTALLKAISKQTS